MSGSSRSLAKLFGAGFRVASTELTPEYSNIGAQGQASNVNARLKINAYMNVPGKANGGKGRNEIISFTIWGKMATLGAWLFSPGKEFNCEADPHVYDKRQFFPSAVKGQPGTPIINPLTGQQHTSKALGFTIRDFTLGEDSDKTANEEIKMGWRPAGWRNIGTPDYQAWRQILKARLAQPLDVTKATYGYAKLSAKRGPGFGAYNPALASANANSVDQAAVQAAVGAMLNGETVNVGIPAPVQMPIPPAQTLVPGVQAPTGMVAPFTPPAASRGF